jgi:hypothetical protein
MGRLLESQGYLGNLPAWILDGPDFYFWFGISDKNGSSADPTNMGTFWVRKNSTERATSSELTISDAISGRHGLKRGMFAFNLDSWYESGKDYTLYSKGMVIDSETVDVVICHFSIENRTSSDG